MSADHWVIETYFEWLKNDAFSKKTDRTQYEGCLRVLHDIPFYWTIWSDENRAGDALSFRQNDFLEFQDDLGHLDQVWLGQWAMATPSVLEVLLGMSRRWSFYFDQPVSYFFDHMFKNMGLHYFPGKIIPSASQERIRAICDEWMARQFQPNGAGSPFPVNNQRALDIVDMRTVEIWGQMNAYSAEHFQ